MANKSKTPESTTEAVQEFVETPTTTTTTEATIEVPTGEVVVKVVSSGEVFTTSLNNWNSMYKNDVVSEGVYKYELVEEKKKLLS